MGQDVSCESDDIKHFRKMVKHTFLGNLEKLKKHLYPSSLNFQISRASYLDLCKIRLAKNESIIDSLERESRNNKHTKEKIAFFQAVDQGKICLGDTLLHLAVRLNYPTVVEFLVENNAREDIPNFYGHSALKSCNSIMMRIIISEVETIHNVVGFNRAEEHRIHTLIRNMKRIWPFWMFNSAEAAGLIRVMFDIRSSHPLFTKLLKIVNDAIDRYEMIFTQLGLIWSNKLMIESDGKAYMAIDAFQKYSNEKKLNLFYSIFQNMFYQWKKRTDQELENSYLMLIEQTIDVWVTIIHDFRLNKNPERIETLTKEDLKKYYEKLWEHRLHPTPDVIDILTAHLLSLQNHLLMENLKA